MMCRSLQTTGRSMGACLAGVVLAAVWGEAQSPVLAAVTAAALNPARRTPPADIFNTSNLVAQWNHRRGRHGQRTHLDHIRRTLKQHKHSMCILKTLMELYALLSRYQKYFNIMIYIFVIK